MSSATISFTRAAPAANDVRSTTDGKPWSLCELLKTSLKHHLQNSPQFRCVGIVDASPARKAMRRGALFAAGHAPIALFVTLSARGRARPSPALFWSQAIILDASKTACLEQLHVSDLKGFYNEFGLARIDIKCQSVVGFK
jgi:hypothetical protein